MMKKIFSIMLIIAILSSMSVFANDGTHGFSYNSDSFFAADFAQTTGQNISLGSSGWRSMNANEGSMGKNNNAWFKIQNGKMYLNPRNTSGRSDQVCRYNDSDTNIPALVYDTPSKYLTGNQVISFSTHRMHDTCTMGVRFMVHNDGKNYYAVVLGGIYTYPHTGTQSQVAYKIYKCVNGSITAYKEVLVSDTVSLVASGEFPYVNVVYENGTIKFNMDSFVTGSDVPTRSYADSWTDPTPFTFAENDTATVWLTAQGAENNDRYVLYENVEINSLTNETKSYDDGTLRYTLNEAYEGNELVGSEATINGFSSSAESHQTLTVPEKITVEEVEYKVTKIANEAFRGDTALMYVKAKDSVLKEIGESAFRGTGIRTAEFPRTLNKLSTNVFRGCDYLASVNIPEGIKEIPAGTFYSVAGLYSQSTYLELIFEGNETTISTTGDRAISLGGSKTLKAVVSHPGVLENIKNYCSSAGITSNSEYVMQLVDGNIKFYAPETLEEDTLIIAAYEDERLMDAKIIELSVAEGEEVFESIAEQGLNVEDYPTVKAFMFEKTSIRPLTNMLIVK